VTQGVPPTPLSAPGSEPRTWRRHLGGVVVGAIAGALSGLFGVGGGVFIVPGLVFALHMGQRLAHGTSLAAVIPIASAALVGYILGGAVDWGAALFLAIGSVAGVLAGTHALRRLPETVLRYAFGLMLLGVAIRLLVALPDAPGRPAITVWTALALVAFGAFTGAMAGLLGVGGGVVMVPGMVLLFAIPDAIAKGTSLAVIIPTSLLGTARNMRNVNADLPIALSAGLAGVGFAFLTSQVSLGLDPRVSMALFGLLLVAVSARLLLQRKPTPPTAPVE
jgi:uncharacterized protein